MGNRIECFFLRPSPYAEVNLRRYTPFSMGKCPLAQGGHDASTSVGTVDFPLDNDLDGCQQTTFPENDPLWPKTCACGYEFQPGDHFQEMALRLYWRGDHVALRTTIASAPPGAMWFADWYDFKGPDGHCLVVKTPGGDWVVDGPAYANGEPVGNGWTRTGEVPKVTASPSIHFVGKYHGFLRAGFLEEC